MFGPSVTNPKPTSVSVLVVEDERISRRALTALLLASGYRTSSVSSAEEALGLVKNGSLPTIAVVDLDLPGMNGLDLIEMLERLDPGVFPVLITGADTERLEKCLEGRHVAYLRKPLDFRRLLLLLGESQTPH